MSSQSSSSSLQRAVVMQQQQQQQQDNDWNKPGGFEACFSQGLNLSEFGGTSSNNRRTSASAELLKLKQQVSKVRQEQQRQDAEMARSVQQRTEQWKQLRQEKLTVTADALSSNRDKHMGNFLLQMHQGDDKVKQRHQSKASRHTTKKKQFQSPLRQGKQKKKLLHKQQCVGGKAVAAKKNHSKKKAKHSPFGL